MKPPLSYAQLIMDAMAERQVDKITLSEIYEYAARRYAYYRSSKGPWKVSRSIVDMKKKFLNVCPLFWNFFPSLLISLTLLITRMVEESTRNSVYSSYVVFHAFPLIISLASDILPFVCPDLNKIYIKSCSNSLQFQINIHVRID